MAQRGQSNVIGGNYNLKHMRNLVNRGATSNARFRIVPLTLRKSRKRGRR